MATKTPYAESFRLEVARLARKEIRAHLTPLTSDLKAARKKISAQAKEIARLQRELKRLGRLAEPHAGVQGEREQSAQPGQLPRKWRKDTVRATRRALGLTQGELAEALGVSIGSVNGWETGRTEPRHRWKQKVLQLRESGVE